MKKAILTLILTAATTFAYAQSEMTTVVTPTGTSNCIVAQGLVICR